ncbi:ROK family protein [Paucibacter sp. R3-3]|uniref:ROK family protein n=1 Tax=Roseateles agri TaxID=3098619 RepID=A0ABU5DLW0_9BURK|nr:ROK family protein [Paucibacter sp. R3-3]MDY0747295.1 ROK family protein [Paucibacter sp. R3-3]
MNVLAVPEASFAVGIDLGGTQVRAALVDGKGTLLARAALPTDKAGGPKAVLGQMQSLVHEVSRSVGLDKVPAVGVASPGPLDARAGVILTIPTLPGWVDIPLVEWLSDWLGKPVTLGNDGVVAAVGEWHFGAGRGLQDFVYVTVSTGIGGGVIADGRVLQGRRSLASHLGHMTVEASGPLCQCGNPGCWEALASGTALGANARAAVLQHPASRLAALTEPLTGQHVFEAAAQGDALAQELVANEGRWLGVGIVNLLHLYSPELVVIGGGVSHGFELLHPIIRQHVDSYAMPPFRSVPIVRAALGSDSGLVGAAALAFMSLAEQP